MRGLAHLAAPLLDGGGDAVLEPLAPAPTPRSGGQQLRALLRKQAQLKARAPWTAACEVLLPAILCLTIVLGARLSDRKTAGTRSYVPVSALAALESLEPTAWLAGSTNSCVVPPLELYANASRAIAHALGRTEGVLAIVPRGAAAARVREHLLASAPSVRAFLADDLASEAEVEAAHVAGARLIWAAVVVAARPGGAGGYDFTIRMPHAQLPASGTPFDRFAVGLGSKWPRYYSSGFLSLQLALLDAHAQSLLNRSHARADAEAEPWAEAMGEPDGAGTLLRAALDEAEPPAAARLAVGARALPPAVAGVPFPTAPYDVNAFFEHVGNLIGLVLAVSMVVPMSGLLRGLVDEKETRLRESMLCMGLRPWALHASWALSYGVEFGLVALLVSVELAPSAFPLASPSLVGALFALFALASLSFALCLAPLFRSAKVAAVAGPLAFFVCQQLSALFLDRETGVLVEGGARLKALASLLPPLGFTLGVNVLCLLEGAGRGADWASVWEGEYSLGLCLLMLAVQVPLYLLLALALEALLPGEFGTRPPRLRACWRRRFGRSVETADADADADADGARGASEPLSGAEARLGLAVECVNVRKAYPDGHLALRGLDLALVRGQITALLGANGAGKR
jgi:hypothetical protein